MLKKEPNIETSSILSSGNSFISETKQSYGPAESVEYIIGTVYADEDGTLRVQFDDGSDKWDGEETRDYTANENLGFKVPVVSSYHRIVYDNGTIAQNIFRLKAWEMT